MAQRPKAKRKRSAPKNTDKKQSERFIAAALKLGVENTEDFEVKFKKIVPPKRTSEASLDKSR
jgi:hypothetical protein